MNPEQIPTWLVIVFVCVGVLQTVLFSVKKHVRPGQFSAMQLFFFSVAVVGFASSEINLVNSGVMPLCLPQTISVMMIAVFGAAALASAIMVLAFSDLP